ncbi:amidohydrolase family protein [Streptomyces sp. NPDC102441]|uniref:amidohydrolase family protein n=1 Tax=Streptomyces sp. NPDC102441 TaxID=3366176 RepID=UPI00381ED42E
MPLSQTPAVSPTTLFEGARVLIGDGATVIDEAHILVRDGLIADIGPAAAVSVPADAQRIDLSGKTVMPTIINPHAHVGYLVGADTGKANYSRANVLDHLRRLAYYGVGVVQSLGTDRDDTEIALRDEQRAGVLDEPGLPLLLTAGNGLAAPTPGSDNGGAFFAPDVIREVTTPDEARAVVRELSVKNPDVIKFWVDDRSGSKVKLGPSVYAAIIDEAHRLGHSAIAHIFDLEDAKGVVRAGVDGVAHMVREPGPDAELIALLKEHDVFTFTSMGIQRGVPEGVAWLDDPSLAETVPAAARTVMRTVIESVPAEMVSAMKESYAVLEAGLRTLLDGGARVLLSADTGVFTQFFGFSEHRELEAMVRAGMPVQQAIQAATQGPARMLGLDDRGTLERGKRADLLVLDADPLQDITRTRRIAAVYFAGRALDRDALRAGWAEATHA